MRITVRFDTVAYRPPARAETRLPVLAGQARCSTGVTIRAQAARAAPKAPARRGGRA